MTFFSNFNILLIFITDAQTAHEPSITVYNTYTEAIQCVIKHYKHLFSLNVNETLECPNISLHLYHKIWI